MGCLLTLGGSWPLALAGGEVQNNVLFHPHSPFRARWDLLVILVIVYQVGSIHESSRRSFRGRSPDPVPSPTRRWR